MNNTIQDLTRIIAHKRNYLEQFPDTRIRPAIEAEIAVMEAAAAELKELQICNDYNFQDMVKHAEKAYRKYGKFYRLSPMGVLYYHHFGAANTEVQQKFGQYVVVSSNLPRARRHRFYVDMLPQYFYDPETMHYEAINYIGE